MTREPTPESWIGWQVAVTLNVRNPDEFRARLEEVNDQGATLIIGLGSPKESPTFYPWTSIRRLRLCEGSNARPTKEPGERLAGDPGWFS